MKGGQRERWGEYGASEPSLVEIFSEREEGLGIREGRNVDSKGRGARSENRGMKIGWKRKGRYTTRLGCRDDLKKPAPGESLTKLEQGRKVDESWEILLEHYIKNNGFFLEKGGGKSTRVRIARLGRKGVSKRGVI